MTDPFSWEPPVTVILRALAQIDRKVNAIMAAVQVNQEDLDALDQALDAATQSLADKIAALNLPEGDVGPLLEDVAALQALAAPAPVEPPVEPPAA
jgi:hypothetical protein